MIFWLHHRSAEPSVTSVDCYWKSSKLSKVGKSLKFITPKDLAKNENEQPTVSGNFFIEATEVAKRVECRG